MGLAIGAEQMGKMGLLAGTRRGAAPNKFEPEGRYGGVMPVDGWLGSGTMPAVFGQAGMEYAYKNDGVGFEQFAKVAEKNHAHSALNPLAQYQKVFSLEEIMDARVISYPNTLPMCCPTGDGAAAIVLVSESKLKTLSLEQQKRAVKISASVLTSDPWTEGGESQPDVNTLTRNAADKAYELAGVGPDDLDLVELHDCFATAELIHYDNLGLCEPGGAGEFIDKRGPWRDGTHAGQRVRRPALEGPPDRHDRRGRRLRGHHAAARRGGRPPDRGRQGGHGPRHRPRLGLRHPHPREGQPLIVR